MAVLYDDDKKVVNDAWQTVNSPVVKAVQATQNTAKAAYGSDGKIYATGGSGKQFVYNPDTGNIGVNNGGTWNYVKSGDATYGATLSAMNADTGNLGSLYKAKEEAQAAQPTQPTQPEPIQIGTGANLDGLTGYGDLFNRYAGGYQQVYDNLAKGIDASTAYQEQLAQQKAERLAREREANNRAAYAEYMRQTNPYGYNAEVLASMGLSKSGYAESSLVAYGNALMAAIQSNNISYNDAMMNLENIAAEARLNGDTQKAQLAGELMQGITNNLLSLGQAQIGADASAAAAEAQRAWEAQQNELDRQAKLRAAEIEKPVSTPVNLTIQPQLVNGGVMPITKYPQMSDNIESPVTFTKTFYTAQEKLQNLANSGASSEALAKVLNDFYSNKLWAEPLTDEEYIGLAKQYGLM